MPKGAGRKTFEKAASMKGAPSVADTISPEDAERAAASFVPLWQFDDASFEVGAKVSDEDIHSLASPVAAVIVPAAAVTAAPAQAAPVDGIVTATNHAPVVPPPSARPQPEAADSVILGPGVVAATPEPPAPVTAGKRTVIGLAPVAPVGAPPVAESSPPLAPPSARPAGQPPGVGSASEAASPAVANGNAGGAIPRSSRPVAEAVPAPRPRVTSDAVLYPTPRRRGPVLAMMAIVGSGVIVLAIYFVSTAMSAPAPVSATPTATHAPPEPKVNIPPPPPVDETPVAATTAAPVATPQSAAAAPPHATQAPSPQPPRTVAASSPPVISRPTAPSTPHTTPRPAAAKNPSPSPHPGDIVRDNPF
jgi:hypothetical protein